jgi:hypothetical protein
LLFANYEAKRAENGVKKEKNGFYKRVFELNFATINGQPTKLLKIVVQCILASHEGYILQIINFIKFCSSLQKPSESSSTAVYFSAIQETGFRKTSSMFM